MAHLPSAKLSARESPPKQYSKMETILVAEDDSTDAFFPARAFGMAGVPTALQFVRDGQEAIDYLVGEGRFANRVAFPGPDLLLMDLKMPRKDGFQVLDWVREQPHLKRLPIIIFSSSSLDRDINRAYDLGANSYLVKPHSNEDLLALVAKLKTYWIEASEMPDVLTE